MHSRFIHKHRRLGLRRDSERSKRFKETKGYCHRAHLRASQRYDASNPVDGLMKPLVLIASKDPDFFLVFGHILSVAGFEIRLITGDREIASAIAATTPLAVVMDCHPGALLDHCTVALMAVHDHGKWGGRRDGACDFPVSRNQSNLEAGYGKYVPENQEKIRVLRGDQDQRPHESINRVRRIIALTTAQMGAMTISLGFFESFRPF